MLPAINDRLATKAAPHSSRLYEHQWCNQNQEEYGRGGNQRGDDSNVTQQQPPSYSSGSRGQQENDPHKETGPVVFVAGLTSHRPFAVRTDRHHRFLHRRMPKCESIAQKTMLAA